MMDKIEIYTDGACKGNPGPGGWGALLRTGEHVKELFGGEANTTNNRMALRSVIETFDGLAQKGRTFSVVFTSDSKYVVDGMTAWVPGWMRRGWTRSTRWTRR